MKSTHHQAVVAAGILALSLKGAPAFAQSGAAGQDSLLALVGAALHKAQLSGLREDWEAGLKAAQAADAVLATPQTKFYVGVSAFSIGANAVQNVQKMYNRGTPSPDDRPKICPEAKTAEDRFATAQVATPAGSAYEKNTADQITASLAQYREFIRQIKLALHC